eukprot:gene7528-10254_t
MYISLPNVFFKSIRYSSSTLQRSLNLRYTTRYKVLHSLNNFANDFELIRGTPQLVDKLVEIVAKNHGIELEMNLYQSLYAFELDQFQLDGLNLLISGKNVLVATPTGSGKTLVGELAIYFALMMGLRVAYTTPLKALSNQKFQDFKARFGGDRVGLLTGDISINRGASITVMTTEVFRNMVYDADSQNQLSNLFMVCFDEFHFMNDPERGTVWEESVISCPKSVRILALSATMGNVDEIKGWISTIHGPTELVVSDNRPVPLRYLFALRQGLFPLFRDPNAGPGARSGVAKLDGKLSAGTMINPSIVKVEEQFETTKPSSKIRKGFRSDKSNTLPRYGDVVEELRKLDQLPAIFFIFSRVGCEQAAKLVMQNKNPLLTQQELTFVNEAINKFLVTNPEIPVAKTNIQMLRAGVGVHHAGLINVWKSFIEDLFNANKIKILFATETLAAGVNMPARSTVITTVTKRINSEVIKLKTSQLLQMAGRAGRRGKDVEGTVVLMKNRFENVGMGHRILTSPIDGIKSHFRTSYGLAVKLLQTRSLAECKELIEKGFGSYLLQKKLKMRKESSSSDSIQSSEEQSFRDILLKYTMKGTRDFLKLSRRLEKEQKNLEFLTSKLRNTESDLVQAITDYMPLGIGIFLRNGDSGYFLGDVKWGKNNLNSGYGVMTRKGEFFVVKKEHIQCFSDSGEGISPKEAKLLLEVINFVSKWEHIELDGVTSSIIEGKYDTSSSLLKTDSALYSTIISLQNSLQFSEIPVPGSIIRQKMILDNLHQEYDAHPIVVANDEELVMKALLFVSKLKDPIKFMEAIDKNNLRVNGESRGDEVYAWKNFLNVANILVEYSALEKDQESKVLKPTEFGQLVGSLSGDNELWLALILNHPAIQTLNVAEFSAIICGMVVDGFKISNAYFKTKPSTKIQEVFAELEPFYLKMKIIQSEANVDFPIYLSIDAAGLVQNWVNGMSWRELCQETTLDQGDICRMLRRTLEVLSQIPDAFCIQPYIAQLSYEAKIMIDRFPVADFESSRNNDQQSAISVSLAPELEEMEKDENETFREWLFDDEDTFLSTSNDFDDDPAFLDGVDGENDEITGEDDSIDTT